LFGHICRLHEDTPARIAMDRFYIFKVPEPYHRNGLPIKQPTSLPKTLNEDLRRIYSTQANNNLKLVTHEDLKNLIQLAQDRNKWNELVAYVTTKYQDEQIYKLSHSQINTSNQQISAPRIRKWTDHIKDLEETQESPQQRRRISDEEMEKIITRIVEGDFMEI